MKIVRQPSTSDGTLGTWYANDNSIICYTIELPWKDNDPQVSCIPEGSYQVIPHNSLNHPNTWEIIGVPNRSSILIHNGNTEQSTLGCVCVGDSISTLNGLPAVLNSNKTLDMLRGVLPDSFLLTIIWGE